MDGRGPEILLAVITLACGLALAAVSLDILFGAREAIGEQGTGDVDGGGPGGGAAGGPGGG